MSATDRRSPRPESPASASAVDDAVEQVLTFLRREWKAGCSASNAYRAARSGVQRLQGLAATNQTAEAIAAIAERLGRYREVAVDQRQQELTEIAAALNAAKPLLRATAAPAPPMGKLPSAVAPGMGPKPRAPRREPTPPPVVSIPPDAAVTGLARVGPAVAKKLGNLGVVTVEDLLTLAPRRHIDYSRTEKIGTALGFGAEREVTIRGEVIDLREVRGPGPPRVVVKIADDSGWVRVTWFNQYIARQLAVGDEIAVSGKLDANYGTLNFTSPEWEKVAAPGAQALSTGRLTPVYPLTQGLAQKTMRGLTRAALDATRETIQDFLPDGVRTAAEPALVPLATAYEQAHYPADHSALDHGQRRLAFDDLFLLQLGLVRRKRARQAFGALPFTVDEDLLRRFQQGLPFRLTAAQQRVLATIWVDLREARPMMRLVQGDVGSGKTVVAAAATIVARANARQSAVMAPTEILAEQHLHNLRGVFAGLPQADRPTVRLLTGSTRAVERRETLAAVAAGETDVLVGTHALIQATVEFARLGFVVVDEQHRFGVRQRSILPEKATGEQPHLLSMTATPIPRTLNMVLNGDLDVSVIDERPPGRIPIETRRFVGAERCAAYDVVWQEVDLGHQVFVICPLVEASEATEAKAAVDEAARLERDVFPDLRIATLHGRMSGKEKDRIMTAFRDHDFDLLVSTSVIEVGIDVPNATVMLVEGADRFGLAQLHQFRGRVGRGGARSFCLLLAEEASPDGEERLRMMVETDDGFLLAEKDLELRGPGDFIGTRQSGLPELSWIDGSFDTRLLDRAREAAETVLDTDPELTRPEHERLARRMERFWERAAPDVPV